MNTTAKINKDILEEVKLLFPGKTFTDSVKVLLDYYKGNSSVTGVTASPKVTPVLQVTPDVTPVTSEPRPISSFKIKQEFVTFINDQMQPPKLNPDTLELDVREPNLFDKITELITKQLDLYDDTVDLRFTNLGEKLKDSFEDINTKLASER